MADLEKPRVVPSPAERSAGRSGDERDIARIARPTTSAYGMAGLGLTVAADLSGVIPDGAPAHAAGIGVATVALVALGRHCIRPSS